tara:strand:- start:1264 stop:3426 length:2163 start_codon:yes stop_codon:yes gene_type:complete
MARQKIEVEIKIKGTQAQVKIKQLDNAFRNAATGAKTMQEAVRQNNNALKGSVADLQRQIRALELVRDNTAKTTKQFFQQDRQIQQLRIRLQKITDTNSKFARTNEDLISSAGLAGATLTEFGRLVSDLPFGIRGVANNLSQLSTLMVTLMAKTGGTTKAFGLLFNQLKGPLGLIIAFQGVIAAIDFFLGGTKKAKDATEDLTESLSVQSVALQIINDRLNDVNLSLENRLSLISAASVASSRLTKIQESEILSDKQKAALSQQFINLELARQAQQTLREDAIKKRSEAQKNLIKSEEDLAAAELRRANALNRPNPDNEIAIANRLSADAKTLNEKSTTALNAQEEILVQSLKTEAEIRKQQNDLIRLATSSTEDQKNALEDLNAVVLEGSEFFKVFNEGQERLKDLQQETVNITLANFKKVLAEQILQLKQRSKSTEEFEIGKQQLIEQSAQKEIDLLELILAQNILTVVEREKLEERLAKLKTGLIKLDDEALSGLEKIMKVAKAVATSINQVVAGITASVDAEISQEERKTVLLNNQLKKRLRNENLSKDERISINKQIENNEVALQEKRDKLAERAFKAQKAASIASALIGTAESAIDAFGTIKGMKFLGPAALPLAIAAAATATAFGLKQVDAIRKTQFVPSAAPSSSGLSGSGGGFGGGSTDPAFNIVGTGQQFQLAQVIAQRTGEPIRAFVVSGDVRTGLALDRNIINSSKLD